MKPAPNSLQSAEPQTALFLLAHNDDEFFVLPRLDREIAAGNRIICVYTTDGAAYGESPERRLQESKAVLCRRGVAESDILPLGEQLGIRDGTSFQSIEPLWQEILSMGARHHFSRIYVPAWEGGHADHDAAHLLAVALARTQGSEVFEFSLYHCHRAIKPLIRCMSLVPFPGLITQERVSFAGALSWAMEARRYPSQRRAFLGLLPFCLPQILLRRALCLRRVEDRNYRVPPHAGKLFYEIRFKVPYEEFRAATRSFVDYVVAPQRAQQVSAV